LFTIPALHRWSYAQRAVNPAEVVPREVQTERGPQAFPLLAEAVRYSRKPSNLHTHGEILALDMGCTNFLPIQVTEDSVFAAFPTLPGDILPGTFLQG
jgi:hypothetical protein